MNFREILGQDRTVGRLKESLLKNSLPSVLFFHGPDGIGKRLVALGVAKSLNCEKTDMPEIFYCNECLTCQRIDRLTYPDVILLRAEESSIKIENIRELLRMINLKSYEGRRKLAIIDDAHLMTTQSANALLKTLEEPPEKTSIILISSNPGLLPFTLRSRCSPYVFRPLSREVINDILEHKAGKSREILGLASGLSDGSVSTALFFLDEALSSLRLKFIQILSDPRYNIKKSPLFSEKQLEDRDFVLRGIYMLKSVTMDIIYNKFSLVERIRNKDFSEKLKSLSGIFGKARLWSILRSLDYFETIIQKNVNRRLAQTLLLNSLADENFKWIEQIESKYSDNPFQGMRQTI